MAWWVYIVECSDGTLYAGSTTDVAKRIVAHNAGRGAKYTRARRPVVLRYLERTPDRGSALRRELEVKRLGRAEKLRLFKSQKGA